MLKKPKIAGIYVVTDSRYGPARGHVEIAEAAVKGGAGLVQLRDKELPDRAFLDVALRIRKLTEGSNTLFLVNNRPDIAVASGADGVHLGQDDLPVPAARRILGPEAVIGVSIANVEEAVKAEKEGADYVAVSPVFSTISKDDAGEGLGLKMITDVKSAVGIPVVGIGGIYLTNIGAVAMAGADSAAVISAVTMAADMMEAIRELAGEFIRGRGEVS